MQEEISDPRCLDPGHVGSSASKNAGFVLHGAADWTEAHHAVHLPAVPPQLAQQGAPGVPLRRQHARQAVTSHTGPLLWNSPHLARSRRVLLVSEPGADHGVADPVAPELLLPAGLEVDDGQAGLIQRFCQGDVLLPTCNKPPFRRFHFHSPSCSGAWLSPRVTPQPVTQQW